MSKIKLYEKDGRLVVILPGSNLFLFEQDGDLQAINGTASDEVTLRFTQNQENFVLNYAFGNFVQADGTTQIGSTRDATVTNLNSALDKPPQLRGDLDVNGKTITSRSNGDVVIDPDGTGKIRLISDNIEFEGAGTFQGGIKLFESDITGENFIAFKAPISVTSDVTLTLPDGAGSANQVLQTNGFGTLAWATVLDGTNDTLRGVTNIKDTTSARGQLLFYDDAEDNFIALKAKDTLNSDTTYTLPADGNNGQVLQTNGSGTLSWTDQSGGGGSDGWHGSTSQIKVLPSEFMAGLNVGRAVMDVRIKDNTSNTLGAVVDVSTGKAFAFVAIPDGYKAVSVKITLDSVVSGGAKVSQYSMTDGAITNSQTMATNTTVNLTSQLTSSATNALAIQVSPGSTTNMIHGAIVAIQAV